MTRLSNRPVFKRNNDNGKVIKFDICCDNYKTP